jgi:hypothetical protein
MTKLKYQDIAFSKKSVLKIEQANKIIAEYQAQGFDLTLRQLYYQFVARGIIPNNDKEYKKLGDVISNARLAGLIDWESITDRTRFLRDHPHWESPSNILNACSSQFLLPKWNTQPAYCEVWIEKDALIGVIEGVCQDLDVPYLACRGYASASEVWRAGNGRFRGAIARGKKCHLFYLGDHDPSGLDMTRDVQARLDLFTGRKGKVKVKRLALNMDQVEAFSPPPNPTKMSDSRASWYVEKFGETCWELDALEPAFIAGLIRGAVEGIRDQELWNIGLERERAARDHLAAVAGKWNEVVEWLHRD